MNNFFVSIIIPCRNEEKFIGKCLDTILKQDYSKDDLEVLVIDGMSTDGTRNIIKNFKYPISNFQLRLLDNPDKFTPFALNIGIKEAKGDIIIRMDAHAGYEKDYVSKCVKYLTEYKADNVGGIMKTLPRENTIPAKAITLALSSLFGVGGSTFRKGSKEIKWVETVFGGCYKKEIFKKIGLFNEKLIKGQDWEFNLRLRKAYGKILLVPDIVSYYYARSRFDWPFLKYYFKEGFWAIYPIKFVGKSFISFWRLIPFFFVFSLIMAIILSILFFPFKILLVLIMGAYLLANLFFSLQIAVREKNLRYFFVLPLIFGSIHSFYGLGSGYAILKILKEKVKE